MFLYRLFFTLYALPFLRRLKRYAKGGDDIAAAELAERTGAAPAPGTPSGMVLWFHGASNGELTGARALMDEALARDRKLTLVVTSNSPTARDMVTSWANPRIHARYAPIDKPRAVRRFLAAWQPAALITIENEIWPVRFDQCRRARVPVLVVGARLSAKSMARWRILPGLARRTMKAIASLSAQDAASEERFRELGLPPARIAPTLNLKSSVDLQPAEAETIAQMREIFTPDLTVLAASTHEGEETALLNGFAKAHTANPLLRLILAPRHPVRREAIAMLIKASGLKFAQRSKGEDPALVPVLLADTLGEMPLWYALAGTSFIGGSLIDKGGHTPFEPAQFATAILHGPYTGNHADAYEALEDEDAAMPITSAEDFAHMILSLSRDPARREKMARSARFALAPLRADGAGRRAFWDRLMTLTANPHFKSPN